MIMVKSVGVEPLPNCERQPEARWDAYLHVPDPDALAAEFASRGVRFSVPLKDTHDGLRGFELRDADGYVLFFGHPASPRDREAERQMCNSPDPLQQRRPAVSSSLPPSTLNRQPSGPAEL